MSSEKPRKRFRPAGMLIVLLLSILSLEITILSSRLLDIREDAVADAFMRWRKILSYSRSHKNTKNIILLAIDAKSERILGRYGAGIWLSRKPFVDSIKLLRHYFEPSVLGYDILLIDSLSIGEEEGGAARVSEDREKRQNMAEDLMASLSGTLETLKMETLEDMNRLIFEQGNKTYAAELAGAMEDNRFDCVLAMNLRGGGVDNAQIQIPGWSDIDVHGETPDGCEDSGLSIPYLKDMAIPSSDIHFKNTQQQKAYQFSPNGNLPTRDFLDYVHIAPINVPRETDGVVRRVPVVLGFEYHNSKTRETKQVFLPSFSLMVAMLHLGVEFPLKENDVEVFWGDCVKIRTPEHGVIRIPIDASGRMYLNYDNSFNDFDAISFSETAFTPGIETKSQIESSLRWKPHIDGRIALIGVTATGIDVGATPLYSNIPLVFVQMTAINNILEGSFIAPLTKPEKLVLWIFLFVAVTLLCHFEKTARLVPEGGLFALLYFLMAYAAIHNSYAVLPVTAPVMYITLCMLSVLSYRFFTEEKAKRQIRGMFSTMVSDKVLSYLEENPQSFSLRGHNAEASVFFSDIARFTPISEFMSPEKVTQFLNTYLTPVTNSILESDGFVDKYVGDAVMAVWGVPNPDVDHARKACLSALDQQEIIAEMNRRLKSEYGAEIHVRMSINSGLVTAGNMGSERKFQYTVIGDVVNLASRLEPVNKIYSTKIIIGPGTCRMAREHIETRMLDKIIVKGKKEIVPIYELLGRKGCVSSQVLEVAGIYEEAMLMFFARNWSKCLELTDQILKIRTDGATLYLQQRAINYQQHPPENDWAGEYAQANKV